MKTFSLRKLTERIRESADRIQEWMGVTNKPSRMELDASPAATPTGNMDKAAGGGAEEEAQAAVASKRTIGVAAMQAIAAGATNEAALQAVRREFPKARTTLKSINWHRSQLRKQDPSVPTERELQAHIKASAAIPKTERQIADLIAKLNALRKQTLPQPVPNYNFASPCGEVNLMDLFGDRRLLLAIHNMGQGCRYCTLWADGFNGILHHLESVMSVALLSKDAPAVQRDFANSRNWRFQLASHGGGRYIHEQTVMQEDRNAAGAVLYERQGDAIYRKSSCVFGPGDLYCTLWSLLGLAGLGDGDWTPQYRYWRQPAEMDDGGANLLE